MSSSAAGTSTSDVEVLNVSPRGIWLFVSGKEYFLPQEAFPWFADARLVDVYRVELHHGHHLFWPSLDIDLDVESLEDPDRFPLVAR